MRNYAAADLIKSVRRDEHDKLLAQQMTGLLATRAGIRGMGVKDLAEFAEFSGTQMAQAIEQDPERFSRKLAEAAGRYHVFD
jgi:hypothetical protein